MMRSASAIGASLPVRVGSAGWTTQAVLDDEGPSLKEVNRQRTPAGWPQAHR